MNKMIFSKEISEDTKNLLEPLIKEFLIEFNPTENEIIYVFSDQKTKAIYIECHIDGQKIIDKGTIDVPLDPDSQPEYRANREVVEDHTAFNKMKEDALNKRTFSNIVTEYTTAYNKEFPLKIIGGQHRFLAIKEALSKKINQHHGIKVYFRLNSAQRLDVQLISNTNISVSPDLLDRMYETIQGPFLRDWCQKVGLLENDQDFSDRKTQTSQITVRAARTFIMNYFNGKDIPDKDFDKLKTIPMLANTGIRDEEWESFKLNTKNLWEDEGLLIAGKEFSELNSKQREYYLGKNKPNYDYANKTLNYAILSAWAYIAGVLSKNQVRLKRHYALKNITSTDPLNSIALSKAKHKSDPDNYRGLGTRTDAKERGRLAEMFFLQAEKNGGITSPLIDVAIKKYHMKLALIEVSEAESKL